MGVLDSFFAGGVKGALEGLGSAATSIRAAIKGPEISAEKKAEIELQLLAMEAAAQKAAADYDTEQMRGQVDLMKLDAQSGDKYRAYARPTALWVCVAGLAYTFIIRPLLPWIVETTCAVTGYISVVKPLPPLPEEALWMLASVLLGVGGMRSFDKARGRG